MIPLLVQCRFRFKQRHSCRLWLPLFLVWLLCLPFVPIAGLICLCAKMNPIKWGAGIWALLAALRGTIIAIEQPDFALFISFP